MVYMHLISAWYVNVNLRTWKSVTAPQNNCFGRKHSTCAICANGSDGLLHVHLRQASTGFSDRWWFLFLVNVGRLWITNHRQLILNLKWDCAWRHFVPKWSADKNKTDPWSECNRDGQAVAPGWAVKSIVNNAFFLLKKAQHQYALKIRYKRRRYVGLANLCCEHC